MFEPDQLLAPVSRGSRLVAAGACAVISLAVAALLCWLVIALVRNGGANAVPILAVAAGFAVIAFAFGTAALRLARDQRDKSPASLSRGLYVAAAFFGTTAVLFAAAVVAMRDFEHLDGVIGSLFLAVVSYGCARNANKRGNKNDAT